MIIGISKKNIYNMKPETTEEFTEFAQAIVERLTIYEVCYDIALTFSSDLLDVYRNGHNKILQC